MNSPVSGSLQWTWPPDEALNSLVNYNSELAYIPSPLHSVQNQEASYLDASSKLPTKLSRNPTIYEKELHQIVIDLYSEREEERKPEQIPDTSSFTEMSILQESVETMEDHRKLSSLVPGAYQDNGLGNLMIGAEASHTPERRGGFLMEGSSTPSMEKSLVDGITYTERVKAPQPLDMVRMMETSKGSSEVGSEGYFSQDYNSSATDESEMQSVEDLQGYLMKYQSSKDDVDFLFRKVSTSSDVNSSLFDDSDIHLEFPLSLDSGDISQNEGEKQNTNGSVDTDFESGKIPAIRSSPVGGNSGRSEASGSLEFQCMATASSLSSHIQKSEEIVLCKTVTMENACGKNHNITNADDLSSSRFSVVAGRGICVTQRQGKGCFVTESQTSDNESGTDSVVPGRNSSVVFMSYKDDKSVLKESEMFFENGGKCTVVKDEFRMQTRLPGQAVPVPAVISGIGENIWSESVIIPEDDVENGVDLTLADDASRLQKPSHVQALPVTTLTAQADTGFIFSKADNGTESKEAKALQKPFSRAKSQHDELQCANLEGKVESLQREFANVLEDRKLLKTKLQTVERRLREELERARQTEPNAVSLVDDLRQSKSELENQLMDLQKAYKEKGDHLDEALVRLETANVAIQNLKEKLMLAEGEISRSEERVGVLQTEIDGLRRLLDEAKDQNEKFKRENLALNANVASLVDAKEWLQKQLKVAGEARMKMQLETNELESALAIKTHLVEELKCEGALSNQQLSELQQNSLLEKAQILKHMETVQEGITQQNLAFKELELVKQKTESTLRDKIESLTKLVRSSVEMEKELDAAKRDVVLKESLLETARKEKDEMKEQLRLARESTEEYKRFLSEFEFKFEEMKQNYEKVRVDLVEKKSSIEKLQEEKRILQVSLEVANEERAACDNAIYVLKLDLEKVDRRFKMMKRELASKKGQLEETTQQKDIYVNELRSLREGFESEVNASRAVKDELARKEKIVQEFEEMMEPLKENIASLTQQLKHSEGQIAEAYKERNDVQDQLESAMSEIVLLEEKLHHSRLERARLEGEFQTTQQSNKDEVELLKRENESLREKDQAEAIQMQTEVTRQRDKAINLEQEVKFMADEMKRRESQYKEGLQAFEENLEELKTRKEVAEQDLRKLRVVADQTVVDMKRNYESRLEVLQQEFSGLQRGKMSLEQNYEDLKKKTENELGVKRHEMRQMEKEVSSLKEMLRQAKAEVERMQFGAVELEREKGRLAGVLASQRTLREHVEKIEHEIVAREMALIKERDKTEMLERGYEIQRKKAIEKTQLLEKRLTITREESKRLQCSLSDEKQENVSLKRKVEEGETERVELTKKLSCAEKEIRQLQEKIRREVNEAQRFRSQVDDTKTNLVQEQTQREVLQRQLEAVLAQDDAKNNRVESLEWELNRRNREVEYLKEQIRMMEERQQLEMENLKTTVQVCRSESSSLRSELSEVRKAKCAYQTETFEFKDALLSARQVTESLKEELFVARRDLSEVLNDVLSARNLQHLQDGILKKREEISDLKARRDDMETSKNRLSSTICLRPVTGLQECISSLRSQISCLQEQMNDHTDSVLTATTSWRSFKENVQQLQASCSLQNNKLLKAERDNEPPI